MTAISLFLVFTLAKLFSLWGHTTDISAWSPIAFLWQDAAAALAFGAIGLAAESRWPHLYRALYWLLAAWTAINIPVARAVFTPLTVPMLRAAGGPLADSMRLYVTPLNISLMLTVLGTAILLPRLLRRLPGDLPKWASICALAMATIGPTATAHAHTQGMDRNVFFAIAGGRLPAGTRAPEDWRASRYENTLPEDLRSLSGSAKGFNIVMVGLESTAAQYLSLFNPAAGADVTPNLTALARTGIVFENAYATYPESIKGMFSILCSIYPAFSTQPEQYTNAGCHSIASTLGRAGYRTALFHSGRFNYLGMESIIQDKGYETLEDAGDIGGNHQSSFGVDEPATVARILKWVDALPRNQRFFLTYIPIAGHHPYATPSPGPFPVKDEVDQYRNALYYGDTSLGALVKGLRDRGLDNNTLWLIYGDHGEAFHQHEGNYGHTFFLYEENVHVPLVIAGTVRRGRIQRVVSLIDIAPTILDLAGIPAPANYQGRTMLDPTPRTALFFADYSLGLLGLRDGPWKFIAEVGSSHSELYDLTRDPRESTNLAARQPAIAAAFGATDRGWSSAQRRQLTELRPNDGVIRRLGALP